MHSEKCIDNKERHGLNIIRATETYQQAGAYYVRIQAMAKKHHITLRQEFDEHDTPDGMLNSIRLPSYAELILPPKTGYFDCCAGARIGIEEVYRIYILF